jgi:hypothetical protein
VEAWATPKYEHVFQKPLDEALAVTRKLLEEKGFTFEEKTPPGQLLTHWKGPDAWGTGDHTRWRYFVTGIAVAPRQSVVRIFRMKAESVGNDVELRGLGDKLALEAAAHEESVFEARSIHRMRDVGAARASELRGFQRGSRDLELERALTLRLESGPSIEVLSGNVRWEPPPALPVRGEDFYLTRWREDGTCERTVRGAKAVLKPGALVLIGELLGSAEAPAVVGDLVCEAASAGLPVALGLSIPDTEQERIDRYLASPGAPADQDALLEGRFWQRPYQDGRGSRAIFDLIDRVRAMRAEGLLVSLVAYDTDVLRASERDAALADVWLKHQAARPEEVRVVLAGNTHTRTVTGTPWDSDFTPMAHHLRKLPGLLVLELGYAKGRRWGCDLDAGGRLDCDIVGASPERRVADHPSLSPYLRLYEAPTPEGFQGLLFVGPLSPSLPAITPPAKAPPPRYRRGLVPPSRRTR